MGTTQVRGAVPGGAIAIYQGWVCCSVRLSRTRGIEATRSQIEFHCRGYPGSFRIDPSVDVQPVDISPFLGRLTGTVTGGELPQPGVLRAAGELVLLEVTPDGRIYKLRVAPLYVVSVNPARRSNAGEVSRLVVTLADARYRWDRGTAPRWSYNRVRADGSIAADSVKRDGSSFTWQEIAGDLVGALHEGPRLGRVPPGLQISSGPFGFAPYSASVEGLGELARVRRLEQPCLAWDGSVSLWSPGEGRLGYAPVTATGQAQGAENSMDLPPELMLHKAGTGKGHSIEAGHPPAAVVVVGKERVATSAIDDAEPVLEVEERILPLTEDGRGEATVRELTGGRYGLDWLKIWILAPRTDQKAALIDPEVAEIFSRQAWRLFRLRGVELPAPGAQAASQLSSALGALGAQAAQQIALLNTQANAVAPPGPNAHLLPLLDRAETRAGRRLPVQVETYSFTQVRVELGGSVQQDETAKARLALQKLRDDIRAGGFGDPYATFSDGLQTYNLADLAQGGQVLGGAIIGQQVAKVDTRSPNRLPDAVIRTLLGGQDVFKAEEITTAITNARVVAHVKERAPSFAALFEEALLRLYKAEGLGRDALLEAAKEVLEFERALNESRNRTETVEEQLRENLGQVDAITSKVRRRLLDVRRAREEERLRQRAAGTTGTGPIAAKPLAAMTHRNCPRTVDAHAQVRNAALGLVATSRLAGHLVKPAVANASATSFQPMAVRITFGAVLRPQLTKRVATQTFTQGQGGGEDRVPEILSDDESYFAAWYLRLPGGQAIRRVETSGLQPEAFTALRRSAMTLRREQLGCELIPLEGAGNREQLLAQAEVHARDALLRREAIEEDRVTVARPWPVNCDGVVAGVEIVSRGGPGQGIKGFETRVVTGSAAPEINPLATRVRPAVKNRGVPETVTREGLQP